LEIMTGAHPWHILVATLLALAVVPTPVLADQPSPGSRDAHALSARIDEFITAGWTGKGVKPAPPADDAEFFRRLSLDLNGRTPSLSQLKDFLDDTRPDKRRLWGEELMGGRDNSELFVSHFANYWRDLLFTQASQQPLFQGDQLEGWLRKQVKDNTPYDRMVRELLTGPQGASFFRANENKPENIAGSTARLFLGVKLECAQCHDDRSGGSWTRTQFWELAAFFADLERPRGANQFAFAADREEPAGPARIKIPDKDKWVDARFLDGAEPQWKPGAKPRTLLAEWMATADNAWFARAAANRVWGYFLGTGLVEPVDALGSAENLPSHPELLNELAREFAAHQFDVQYLIRAVTGSQTYQRTSRQTHESQKDPRLFARAAVRGLSAEQLWDSVSAATGYRAAPSARTPGAFGYGSNSPRAEFLAKFNNPHDQRTEVQTSILQALYLMNGKLMAGATSLEGSKNLAAIAGAGPSVPTARRVEELFLLTLSRKPRPEEAERLIQYIEGGEDRKQALADVFWALLNSTEFLLNH
jgi:hypothetical protein